MTFRLRQDARWHDGKPFSPKDVKCTWDLVIGKSSQRLRVNPRRSWYRNLKEVTVDSDKEVAFHLTRPRRWDHRHRWDSPPRIRFAPDSPVEGDGFEPSVPHKKQPSLAAPVRSRNSPSATKTGSFVPGTDGSNPSPSTGESCPNGEAA